MKTNLSIILLTAIFACSLCMDARAQDTKFGVKGGAALYSTTFSINLNVPELGDLSEEEKSNSKFGFAVGLFAEKPFSDIVSGQIELLYVQKGGEDEAEGSDFDDVEVEDGGLTLSYLDVPVMAKVNIPLESDIQPFLYGGGFAGYLLDAKAEADGETIEEDGFELKDLLKDVNYGLVFGGGVSFGNISVDIRYDLGLANIFDSESQLIQDLLNEFGEGGDSEQIQQVLDGIEITTSGLQFTLGISF